MCLQERLGTTQKVLRQLQKEEKRVQRIASLTGSLPGVRNSLTGSLSGAMGPRLSISPTARGLAAAASPAGSEPVRRTSSHDSRTISLFGRVTGRRG